MARPKADAERVARAIEAVRSGTPLAAAAAAQQIGLSTLKRALQAVRGGSAHPAATPAAPAPAKPTKAAAPVATAAPASSPVAPDDIAATIEAALEDIGDDPEARVIGASLTRLGAEIPQMDRSKLPAAMNQLRGLVKDLRAMRAPRPPSPDQVAERLRELDAVALRKIERYLDDADRVRGARLDAIKAWGSEHLSAEMADELAALVDGLDAPIIAPPTHGTA